MSLLQRCDTTKENRYKPADAAANRFAIRPTLLFRLLVAGLLLSFPSFAQNSSQLTSAANAPVITAEPSQSIQSIQELRSRYHRAVVGHDGAGLLQLVLPQASLWLTVLADQPFQALKQAKPDTQKVHASSFQQFAGFLNSSKAQLDPQAQNVKIFTDGSIATVYFDFKFLIDGVVENEGSETWQLVNTEDGWKIAAITYSSSPHRK